MANIVLELVAGGQPVRVRLQQVDAVWVARIVESPGVEAYAATFNRAIEKVLERQQYAIADVA